MELAGDWGDRFVLMNTTKMMDMAYFDAWQAGRGALLNALRPFVDLLRRGRRVN